MVPVSIYVEWILSESESESEYDTWDVFDMEWIVA